MADYGNQQQQQLQQLPQEVSPASPNLDDATPDNKRKRSGDGPQPRAKRNRYISIACNECKRRKIKCNGEHPCQRCGNLQLECVYAPNCCSNNFKETQEYKDINAHVQSLQEQVNVLWQSLNSLRSSLGHEVISQADVLAYANDATQSARPSQTNMLIDPALSRGPTSPQQNKYQGPTSSQYNFDLARSSLQSMGITTGDDGQDAGAQQQNRASSPSSPRALQMQLHPYVQPMIEISKEEALRLCRVYEDEMGTMYPILDMTRIQQHATLVFALNDAVSRTGSHAFGINNEIQTDADMEILKLVLANALVAESGGTSQLAKRLYTTCARSTEVGLQDQVNLKNIQILTLVATYLFHSDQETRSWRVIGVAARLCIELGLHRSETYGTLFATDDERDAALRVFWSVYVLDKRWSLGTGMASALTDSDIDPKLEKPHQSSPYLTCMVDYSKIGSKVWASFGVKDATDGAFNRGDAEYLNYQVLQWYKSVPSFLQYPGPKHADYSESNSKQYDPSNPPSSRALYRMQVILYLRANQMRILVYRPVLHSATQILANDTNGFALKVVDLARDSIRMLTKIAQSSDIYHTQQMLFNYFLVSALAVLFLAVSHAPVQFAATCKDEFYMALDLVRGLSSQSHVSERLWKTIKGLKEIGPKLGLFQRQSESERSNGMGGGSRAALQGAEAVQNQNDAASSAAMAMAGLRAGRPVDETDFFGTQGNTKPPGADGRGENISSPNGMANDLLSLFEAAGAFANGGAPSNSTFGSENRAQVANMGQQNAGGSGVGMAGGHEDDFGRIMRDLF